MKRFFLTLIGLSLFVLPCLRLEAGVRPVAGSESVHDLFDSASLVFTGEVVSVHPGVKKKATWNGQIQQLQSFSALIQINRLYKGQNNDNSISVEYSRPADSVCAVADCESLSPGYYGLFFIIESHGTYHLINEYFGKFPISKLTSGEHNSGLPALASDLIAGLRDTDEPRLLVNIELIGAMGHIESDRALINLLPGAQDAIVRSSIYLALIRLGDYSKLKETLVFAESNASNSRTAMVREQICDWVSEIRSPDVISVLLAFSDSPSSLVRAAVIHALREMESSQAIPAFITRLDDPVQMVRYDAVMGLATIEKKWDLAPSVDNFRSNETKYISAWKNWWINTGQAQYQQHL